MDLLRGRARHLFTHRGWGLLGAGLAFILLAALMGRRDLLSLSVLLLLLPLIALAGMRLIKPRFSVTRVFSPPSVETDSPSTVRLSLARAGGRAGTATMAEHLPAQCGQSPAFRFPSRKAVDDTSRYEYTLHSADRGQYRIGPVTAEFTDPFGLSLQRHALDHGDTLTVTPAALQLPPTGLAGARGTDGITATNTRANPSDDDVMTREYRHGDPMRRVHWAATARHGGLMVRQEESVTTPEATIIMDQRHAAFPEASPVAAEQGMMTSTAFEWLVVAAVSVSTHLVELSYSLRCLDAFGEPAFLRSASSPEPSTDEFSGASGLQSVAESLAAIEVTEPLAHRSGQTPGTPGNSRATEPRQGVDPAAFGDTLLDKLSAHRMRGPIIALLGSISSPEARSLALGAGFGANAFAILVVNNTNACVEQSEILRRGGWRTVVVTPAVPLQEAWTMFDDAQDASAVADTGANARRAASVAP